MTEGPTFYIDNNEVCIRLKLYGEDVRNLLTGNSWQQSSKAKEAEYLFVNTCSFLKKMEDRAIRNIENYAKKKKSWQKLIVLGCLPSINPRRLETVHNSLTFPGKNIEKICEAFNLKTNKNVSHKVTRKLRPMGKLANLANRSFFRDPYLTYLCDKEKVFHLKIAEGCLGKCTFCSEKQARGFIRSKKVREVIKEFRQGLKEGYRIFSLNADDTGMFGTDNNENVAQLTQVILNHKEDFKLVITEMNPFGLIRHSKKLIPLLSSPKVVFVTVPLQSGSKKILKPMRRSYDPEKVLAILNKIRENNPNIIFNTHLIVGFPGETHKDFAKTCSLIDKFHFNKVKVFKYSKRPNTMASRMPNQVSEIVKQKREKVLKRKVFLNQLKNLNTKEMLMNANFIF